MQVRVSRELYRDTRKMKKRTREDLNVGWMRFYLCCVYTHVLCFSVCMKCVWNFCVKMRVFCTTLSLYVSVANEIVYEFVLRHAIDVERRSYRGISGYLTKRKSNCSERRAFIDLHRPCSSEIQVDRCRWSNGTTARFYRDYHRSRQMEGQVRRGIPSSSISFKVTILSYPTVLKVPGVSLSLSLFLSLAPFLYFGEKTMFNSSQSPPAF